MLLAAPRYNYEAVCGIYFLASIGLGGNIPVDALVALEFLPQRRRVLVALLSMFQPIGVVVASAIAYGTAARYRCGATLPACNAGGLAPGAECCTVGSNMGWRYCVLILGSMTLLVFFARFLLFPFYESPKFLLSKGKEQECIDVLNKIAKFNKTTPPTLSLAHFRAIDAEYGTITAGPESTKSTTKRVFSNVADSFKKLKGLFGRKLQLTIFLLLALAYMVSRRFAF
jgi:MFS family permease